MTALSGELFIYDPEKKLVAFESGPLEATTTAIIIGGLTDGLLTLPYVPFLSQALAPLSISTCQPLLSSSYKGYGCSSLARDATELATLISFLRRHRAKQRFILIGHSTGCQDILYYFNNNYEESHAIAFAVLQGAVSDRDYLQRSLPNYSQLLQWSKECCGTGRGDNLFPDLIDGVPVTAYRLHSLLARFADDDYFSLDFTLEERRAKFGNIPVPTHVIFSERDEYVAEHDGCYPTLEASFKAANPSVHVFDVISDADHCLSSKASQQIFFSQLEYLIRQLL